MRLLLLFLYAALALPASVLKADLAPNNPAADIAGHESIATGAETNSFHLSPGPNDKVIAFTVAEMLQSFHYLHYKFDATVSSRALDLYLNTFDPQHIHFLQSDLAEFEQYRTNLGELTEVKHDTSPAYVIFNRFMQRLRERTAYAKQLRHDEEFEFTSNERFSLNRKDAPFPKDINEARQLWRDRARYEYLEEKLIRESPMELGRYVSTKHTPEQIALLGHDFRQDMITFFDKRYARILHNFEEWDSDQVLETYLTAVARVYDPHSDYEGRDTLEDFSIQMSLSLFGIGATLQTDDDGYCKIVSLVPGMPAAKTKKLKENDRIVAVAQGTNEPVDVVAMPLKKAVRLIRGPKGTDVRLTIIPADATDPSTRVTVKITRDEIKLEDQQAKAKLIEMPCKDSPPLRLGVIDLPAFYGGFPLAGARSREDIKSCTLDVYNLLMKLEEEHVDGVILDLRKNGGGLLPEAIDLAGLFIKEGPIVQVASSDGTLQVDPDPDPAVHYDGPLLVLQDRFSASASEIVAGALQDYGRALVVGGASSHGKGTVQSVSQLAPYLLMTGQYFTTNPLALGALKYTTNKFYRVTGSSTQLKGVVPDIILPETYDYMETEEASEDYAMKWDTTNSADYVKLNRVQPYLAELQKRSAARVAAAKDFDYVREDIDLVKKAMAEKSVSLNEQTRLKEGADTEARLKAREAEFKTRKPGNEKIYDIVLTNGVVDMTEEKPKPMEAAKGIVNLTPKQNGAPAGGTSEDPEDENAGTIKPPAEPSPEETSPLEEAEHILTDYIALARSGQTLTAEHPQ